jgi:hypothetical protein
MTIYQFKTIGFCNEQDENSVHKEYIEDVFVKFDTSLLFEGERKKILNYLNEGTMVHSTLLALFDAATYIAPNMLLSDGEWIWTSHFGYYLKKFNFSRMTNEFLNHIRNKNYKVSPVSKKQRTDIEVFLGLKLLNLDKKQRESIRRNAIELGYDISED